MQENQSVTLQTERLILRDFREEDWREAHEYGSDAETVKYMPFGPNTEEETKDFITRTLVRQK
jgi:[ribosomal protein S5]-alanine N-acetyltransferase